MADGRDGRPDGRSRRGGLWGRFFSRAYTWGTGADATSALSGREREILRLTAQGLTKKEVGRTLSISYRTVEKCRQTVQEKLHLGDRVEMVRYAARNGLL